MSKATTHPLDAHVSLVLMGMGTNSRHSYASWEECFIKRWGMVPDHNVPDLAAKYRDMHHRGQHMFTCAEALRIFYTNQFLPRPGNIVARFVSDFQKVPKQLVEPTWENDPKTGDRLERYNELHEKDGRIQRGRQVFDMSPQRNRKDS